MMSALLRWVERLYRPFAPYAPAAPPRELRSFLRWLLREARAALIGLLAAALLVGFLEVGVIHGIGVLVDRVAAADDPATFFSDNATLLIVLVLIVGVARPLAGLAQAAIGSVAISPGVNTSTIWRLHRHTLGHSLRYFEEDFAGRLAQKEMQAGSAATSMTLDVINAFGMLAAFLIGMAAALGAADLRLAAVAVLWTLAYAAILRWSLPPIRSRAKIRAERRAAVTGRLVDSFANIKTVALYARAETESRAAEQALTRYRDSSVRVGRAIVRLRFWLALLNALSMVGVIWLALALWREGAASVGVVAAAATLMLRISAMSNWIAFTALSVFNELGTLEDAIDTLAPPHDIVDAADSEPVPEIGAPPRIEFDGVSFLYGREIGGVRDVDLVVAPGEKVGLVGHSGAGKSTLVALMMRLHEVESGVIRLGGRDIRGMRRDDLRRRIGVITQESAVFNRSVMDNILYGRDGATPEQAVAAAERTQARAFIEDLKDSKGRVGFDAHLGERGVKLSGGQRQRIALARVVLKDAPVLVLDEATSALDSEVEAAILESLDQMMAGKTVIAIAHRLSTIARMDRIVVLEQGQIVETGSHDALLERDGVYARLWARQSGGFLGIAAEPEGGLAAE